MKWTLKNKNTKQSPYDDVSNLVFTILDSRGYSSETRIKEFLNPNQESLHDPLLLPDAEEAVKRILEAKAQNEKVAIYGDYDADGVTATSILWNFFYRDLGINTTAYIPSRFDEGYGLNFEAIQKLVREGISLIVTVDCGIKDRELIDKFPEVDFVVTDHHTLPEKQDFSHLALHPAKKNSKYPFKNLAGAGVAWKFVCAVSKIVDKSDIDPMKYIDLAAIGTIADVMPLVGENRVIVKLGLEKMRQTENKGLSKLAEKIGLKDDITVKDIGYGIGPRINAAGRLEKALNVVKLFSTEMDESIDLLVDYLEQKNAQRQVETQKVLTEAYEQINESNLVNFVYGREWHEGVVGLVAGKIKEAYYKPTIVATKSGELVTASARSIKGVNITEVIEQHKEYLIRFGGHAMAAGFSMEESNLEDFSREVQQFIKKNYKKEVFEREVEIDLQVSLEQLNFELFYELQKLAPFGEGNPEPVFLFQKLEVVRIFQFGAEKQHIKFIITDEKKKKFFDVIAFGRAKEFENLQINDKLDLVARIDLNRWNGQEKLQLLVIDLKKL